MNNIYYESIMIGEKIRIIREARNKTQKQMSQSLGVSVTTYAKTERGEVDITISRLESICKVLKINPAILFLRCNPIQVLGDKINLTELL